MNTKGLISISNFLPYLTLISLHVSYFDNFSKMALINFQNQIMYYQNPDLVKFRFSESVKVKSEVGDFSNFLTLAEYMDFTVLFT